MKTSFVATVFNEEENIEQLITSLLKQSKKVDEIVIVDAKSSDNTNKILSKYKNKIIILTKNGNRSVGRNTGIKKAKGDIILVSDSGCILGKKWVENITKPFEKKGIDVVSGFYHPIASTIFEKALSLYTCVMPDRVDPKRFLPSSRSIAFKKNVWETVDGYPEYLDTCEDLVFAKKAKDKKLNFYFAKNAVVYWKQQKNILQAFNQFYNYAKGDGRALFVRRQTPLLYLRYLIGGILIYLSLKYSSTNLMILSIVLVLGYLIWAVAKNYKYIRDVRGVFLLPLLQVTSDIAVLLGMSNGIIRYLWATRKKQ